MDLNALNPEQRRAAETLAHNGIIKYIYSEILFHKRHGNPHLSHIQIRTKFRREGKECQGVLMNGDM